MSTRRTIGSCGKLPSNSAAEQTGTSRATTGCSCRSCRTTRSRTTFGRTRSRRIRRASSAQHYLGTDTTGRDVVARLVYGFRLAMAFALMLLICNYFVGITLGCAMGFVGRRFDLLFQRLIEVWSNVPFLYVIMIMASVIVPNFWTLVLVMVIFGWMEMTWYMRTSTYREKAREYVMAARALGASSTRIMFQHILPNTVSIIVTFIPFSSRAASPR